MNEKIANDVVDTFVPDLPPKLREAMKFALPIVIQQAMTEDTFALVSPKEQAALLKARAARCAEIVAELFATREQEKR